MASRVLLNRQKSLRYSHLRMRMSTPSFNLDLDLHVAAKDEGSRGE